MVNNRKLAAIFLGFCLVAPLGAQESAEDRYPEGKNIPRNLTEAEKAYLARHPLKVNRATDPPTGPIYCPPEYAPTDGILIAWEGDASFTTTLSNLAKYITGPYGDADLYVAVDSTSEKNSAASKLASYGVDMSRVTFIVATTDTIWIRDYGPRYIYQGGCRAIVDHVYNRPRPNDDVYPFVFADYKNHAIYGIPLIHGGGNFQHSAAGDAYVTELIVNENPGLTEQDIITYWNLYQNVNVMITDALSQTIDSTQHIDMWLFIPGDNKVVISDWPLNPGSSQDIVCDNMAALMASLGYTVYRVPAVKMGGVHYTYTNVLICNNLVVVPTYTSGTGVSERNQQAFDTWKQAMPGYEVVQVNGQSLVIYAGVFHCVIMHMPESLTGELPNTYIISPNGGQTYTPGEQVEIKWISDDNKGVQNVDILLSIDGGNSYPLTIASTTEDDGSYTWTVPDINTSQGKIKVLARDGDGNTNGDSSDENFGINGFATGFITDFTVVKGKKVSGGIAEMLISDEDALICNSLPAFGRPTPGPIELVVGMDSPVQNPTSLTWKIESKINVNNGTGEIALKNWNTGQFDVVGTYALSASDVLQSGTIGSGASNYIRNDGRIEVRLFYTVPFQSARFGFNALFDLVRIELSP